MEKKNYFYPGKIKTTGKIYGLSSEDNLSFELIFVGSLKDEAIIFEVKEDDASITEVVPSIKDIETWEKFAFFKIEGTILSRTKEEIEGDLEYFKDLKKFAFTEEGLKFLANAIFYRNPITTRLIEEKIKKEMA